LYGWKSVDCASFKTLAHRLETSFDLRAPSAVPADRSSENREVQWRGICMQVDDETWAAVRLAYADPSVSLSEIGTRFGLTPMRIGAKAKKDGWTGREASPRARRNNKARNKTKSSKVSRRKATERERPDAPDASHSVLPRNRTTARSRLPTRDARKSIVGRLYRAISLKLEHMEKRMASGEPRSAQDEERESRALATLINNFEKVTEAVAELDKDGNAGRAAARDGADAERMRREIAERLERLGGNGALERGSRKSRS
jgi:hypothetical protein